MGLITSLIIKGTQTLSYDSSGERLLWVLMLAAPLPDCTFGKLFVSKCLSFYIYKGSFISYKDIL